MTDLITEARELCSKATPGLWQVKLHNEDYGQGYGEMTNFVDMGGTLLKIGITDTAEKYTEYSTFSTFIARSRALISELCNALEKERGVMIEHDGCVGCKYEHEDEASLHCDKCTQNSTDKYMPVSNADRIRGMTDEGLADSRVGEFKGFLPFPVWIAIDVPDKIVLSKDEAIKIELDWLRQPVDGERC